jgi:hypothetical protein
MSGDAPSTGTVARKPPGKESAGSSAAGIPSLKPACQQHGPVAGVRQNGVQQLECPRRSPLSAIGAGAPRRHAPTCLHSRYRPRASGRTGCLATSSRSQVACASNSDVLPPLGMSFWWLAIDQAQGKRLISGGNGVRVSTPIKCWRPAWQPATSFGSSQSSAMIMLSCSRAVRDPLASK